MDRAKIIQVLLDLGRGINPDTGEVLPSAGQLQSVKGVQALFLAARELEDCAPRVPDPSKVEDWSALLAGSDAELFEKIREWRSLTAKSLGRAAYTILTNRAIHALVVEKPQSLTALNNVHGIGEKNSADFGQDLIDLIEDHVRSERTRKGAKAAPEAWDHPSPAQDAKNQDSGQPSRAYASWTEAEDEELIRMYSAGSTIPELSEHFRRGKGAIRSRLNKKGLL
jgi:hypothetical protein